MNFNIWKEFSLKDAAPEGVVLLMEDFVLPSNQVIAILSDGDTVTYELALFFNIQSI